MTEQKRTMPAEKPVIWTQFPVVFATALFCCILWGSASPAIKIAYQLFRIPAADTASRIMLAGARFVIAGVMTIAIGSLISRRILIPKAESWGKIGILSLVQTVGQYYFFFMALAHMSGVRGSIINASGNFIAILFAVYLFRFEKMTVQKLTGCIVGFAGIILIMGGPKALEAGGAITLAGEGAMLAADIFYGISGCLIKIYSRDENPVTLSGYQFAIGGAVLFGIGFLMGGTASFLLTGLRLESVLSGIHQRGSIHAMGCSSEV